MFGFNELLHKLMLRLFYPAVLGTVFYSYLPYIRNYETIPGNPAPFLVSLGLLLHFLIDYVYTEYVREYSVMAFLSDLVTLFMLYVAFDSVSYLDHAVNYDTLSLALAVVYAMFIAWDFALRRDAVYFWPLVTYEVVAFSFFLGAFFCAVKGTPLVIGILVASVLLLTFTSKSIREQF